MTEELEDGTLHETVKREQNLDIDCNGPTLDLSQVMP